MILEFGNVLSSELCKEIIQRFELDDRKKEGVIHGNEVNKNIKRSIDLPFNFLPEWHDIKCKIFDHVQREEYFQKYSHEYGIFLSLIYP